MTDTIKIDGHFGPRRVTRADFVESWESHARQLHNLMDFDEANAVIDQVSAAACKKFDERLAAEKQA